MGCCAPLVCEPLNADQAEELAPLFKAIGDPVRLRLLSLIACHEGGEACVCDLTGVFELTGPTISHHLKVLQQAGLIDSGQRRGTWVYYWINPRRWAACPAILGPRAAALGSVSSEHRHHDRTRPRPIRSGRPSCPTLDRFLPVWIAAAMAAGLLAGRAGARPGRALDAVQVDGVSLPIALGLLVMMYPVLAKVRYDQLDTVTRDRRLLIPSLVLNWVVGPALMFALAWSAAARPARLPHRADHRRAGPLHRHGHHLERPGLRRPRGRRRAGRAQLGLPGHRVRRAGLVLPARPARAGSACTKPT